MTPITSGYITLGYKQAAICAENPEVYINCLVKFGSQRSVLMTVYGVLVQEGRLPRIEDLPEEKKRYWWTEARRDAGGLLPKDKLTLFAKCLYCLDYLIQTS